jgi:hypothetical protein
MILQYFEEYGRRKKSLKNTQGLEKESWDVNNRKKEKIEITNLEQLVTQGPK